MPSVKVYKQTGEKSGSVKLDDSVFSAEYNEPLIHQAVVAQLNNARQGTKSALTRTEVRGGGIKPWRQKGTGRARQGSIRAPQWNKGGVVFAPKPRDFSQKVNKKARRAALVSALSAKVALDELLLIDEIKLNEVKTREMDVIMKAFKLHIKTHTELDEKGEKVVKESKAAPKILLIVTESDENIVRAAGNIPYVRTIPAGLISVYDLVASDKCVATVAAIKKIEEAYK
ncbi:MAG: 50S ribosomal protein L4 [Clostridiales bacterium]|jgi:large subunit ribosomal protein L4|nr:50S ribosomal protein L4 [Clostridiales bacterium]